MTLRKRSAFLFGGQTIARANARHIPTKTLPRGSLPVEKRTNLSYDKIKLKGGLAMYQLWDALERAKKLKWVELSHSLNNDSPFWSGIPEGSVELGKVVFDWGNPMLE